MPSTCVLRVLICNIRLEAREFQESLLNYCPIGERQRPCSFGNEWSAARMCSFELSQRQVCAPLFYYRSQADCSYPSLTEEFSCHPKLMCTCASAFQVIWFAKRSAISINKRPKRMSYVMCLLLCFNMSFLFFYLSCAFGYTKYVRYRKLLLKYVPAVLL